MDLFLLRHGIAEEQAAPGSPDSERRLTEEGLQRVRQIALAMRRMELGIELILSSPFPRARETAEVVARALGLERRLEFSCHLEIPPASTKLIAQINRTRPRPQSVLLVGHEPHLSHLASVLLTGSPSLRLALKKGGLCKLEATSLQSARCATLCWLLTPRQMRFMA